MGLQNPNNTTGGAFGRDSSRRLVGHYPNLSLQITSEKSLQVGLCVVVGVVGPKNENKNDNREEGKGDGEDEDDDDDDDDDE